MGALLRRRLLLTLVVAVLLVATFVPAGTVAGPVTGRPTLIACHVPHEFRYFSRPANGELFARQYSQNGQLRGYRNVIARHLKWTGWGKAVAIAKGRFSTAEPLTAVAFDRVHCPDGRWYYGRVNIRGLPGGGKGGFQLRLVRCGARQFGA
jgi:hypothetical protein